LWSLVRGPMLRVYSDPFTTKQKGTILSGAIKPRGTYSSLEFMWLLPQEALRLMLQRYSVAVRAGAFEPSKPWKVERLAAYFDLVARCVQFHFSSVERVVLPSLGGVIPVPTAAAVRDAHAELLAAMGAVAGVHQRLLRAADHPSELTALLAALRDQTMALLTDLNRHLDTEEIAIAGQAVLPDKEAAVHRTHQEVLNALLHQQDREMVGFFLYSMSIALGDPEHGWGTEHGVKVFNSLLPFLTRSIQLPLVMRRVYERQLATVQEITMQKMPRSTAFQRQPGTVRRISVAESPSHHAA